MSGIMYELIFKVLNMSITATLMAMAVILLRFILKKAPRWISYALWSVVLFRLICPFSFSSAFSLLGGIGAPAAESGIVSYIPENIVHAEYPQVDLILPGVSEAINDTLPQGEEQLVADPLEAPAAAATIIWLLGVYIMLAYSMISYILLKRRLSDATLLEGNVFETDAVTCPFVCGLMNPRIYLPVDLPEAERGYVLLHERAHINRRDYLIKPLAFLALSVHWFNPLMWLSFRLMCRDMEMSCDERAARELEPESRAGYSAALLRLAVKRRILPGGPLAFGESDVKDRVRHVLNYKKPVFWIAAAAVIAVIIAAVCLLTNPVKTLELPAASSVLSMEMEQLNARESVGHVVITDGGTIGTVLSDLSGARKTLLQSLTDYPTQDNYLVVRLNLDGEQRTLCLYNEGNAYYIEEPYVGVYRSIKAASDSLYTIYNSDPQNIRALATAYAFDKCLYVDPGSSYYPYEGTGQLYLCGPGSFTIVNEETGEIQESWSLIEWQAKTVDTGEWNGLFWDKAVDISDYQSRIEYNIGGTYRLYQMDGDMWLGHFYSNTLLRLYKLRETDIPASDNIGSKGPSIPDNEPLRVDSPDGKYRAEAYGTNKGATAAGLYPYEGMRVVRNSDEAVIWNGIGYYRVDFLWNGDSRYVAVYGESRIYGQCFIIDVSTGKVIDLPDIHAISEHLDAASQPQDDRPDPYLKVMEWLDDTKIRVRYSWHTQNYDKEISGKYEFDIVSGDIMVTASQ